MILGIIVFVDIWSIKKWCLPDSVVSRPNQPVPVVAVLFANVTLQSLQLGPMLSFLDQPIPKIR
jgi:hypothetical protein